MEIEGTSVIRLDAATWPQAWKSDLLSLSTGSHNTICPSAIRVERASGAPTTRYADEAGCNGTAIP